jgi:hypothetical protein
MRGFENGAKATSTSAIWQRRLSLWIQTTNYIRKFLNTRITRGTPILGANGILIAHLVDGDTTLLLPLSLVYSIPPSALNARISQPQLSSVTNERPDLHLPQ